jgi:hypothetical protein
VPAQRCRKIAPPLARFIAARGTNGENEQVRIPMMAPGHTPIGNGRGNIEYVVKILADAPTPFQA